MCLHLWLYSYSAMEVHLRRSSTEIRKQQQHFLSDCCLLLAPALQLPVQPHVFFRAHSAVLRCDAGDARAHCGRERAFALLLAAANKVGTPQSSVPG